jgi:hypothetical protein
MEWVPVGGGERLLIREVIGAASTSKVATNMALEWKKKNHALPKSMEVMIRGIVVETD